MTKKRGNNSNKPNKSSNSNRRGNQTVDKNNLQLNKRPFRFTDKQLNILDYIECTQSHLTLLGYAGTAKTSTALYGALSELENKNYNKVILIRSAVQTRDIGHLPGTAEEKAQVYEKPFATIVNSLYGRGDAYGILRKTGIIDFELTSFLRGETFDNSIVIVDEAQNMTASELSTVVTRLGINSKLIICGDIVQRDLTKSNEKDVEKVFRILSEMNSFVNFDMGINDIVRSDLVKEFIIKTTKLYPNGL